MIIPNFSGIFSKNNLFSIYVFGLNAYGQLGLGDTVGRSVPVYLNSLNEWSHVSGSGHSLAVKSDGTLWSWGRNSLGQLGLGDAGFIVTYDPFGIIFLDRSSPVQVGSLSDWSRVFAPFGSSFAVKKDGTLWSWGGNNSGKLGHGDYFSRSSPVQVGIASDWAYFSSKSYHCLAIRAGGELWAWGSGVVGQLGNGLSGINRLSPTLIDSNNVWKSVATGGITGASSFSFGLKSDGTLWAWGYNGDGQLGLGSTSNVSSPIQVGLLSDWQSVNCGRDFTAAVKKDDTLWAWGKNTSGQLGLGDTVNRSSPVQIGIFSEWSSVKCTNFSSTLAIKKDGTLWSWGINSSGQLGLGDTVNRSSPVQVKLEKFSLSGNSFIKDNGYLYGFGDNGSGQIGDGSVINKSSPVKIGNLNNWWSLSRSNREHTLAIKTNGTLWSWGANTSGQLGHGDLNSRSSPVQIGSMTDWLLTSAGHFHSKAIKNNGTLWAWGRNNFGQLGLGFTANVYSPVQVGADTDWEIVSAARYHTLGIKTSGTLWAWGRNDAGQLGIGDVANRSSPIQIGTDTNWLLINPGGAHNFAIKNNGTLWAWGYNSEGRLGIGDVTNRSSPVQIGVGSDWAFVSGGRHHAIAIKTVGEGGALWAWGRNAHGQLGIGDVTNRSSPVQVGNDTDWYFVSAAEYFTFAVKKDGTLWSWGRNNNGQLGLGDTVNRSSPVKIGNIFYKTKWSLNRVSSPGESILLAKK